MCDPRWVDGRSTPGGVMDRRTFLHRFGATLGAALGAASLGGCAGLAAARRTDGSVDVPAYVAAMDDQVARIHALPDRPEVEALLASKQLPSGFLKRYMASLFVVAAFRDLPRAAQEHPAMQDRIWAEAPWLGEAQLRLARMMRRLGKAERKQLRATIREDRKALDAVREGLLSSSVGSDMAPARAQQLADLYDQVTFRMRTQDPGVLVDEVVDKIARRAAQVGATEDTWDDLLDDHEPLELPALREAVRTLEQARVAAGGVAQPDLAATELDVGTDGPELAALAEEVAAPWPTVPDPTAHGSSWEQAWGESPRAAKLARTGAILLGIGLALTPAGMILTVFAYWLVFPPVMATVGAVLSIMGLVYMLTAAAEAAKGPRGRSRDDWDR